MSEKKCMIFEDYGSVKNLQIQESSNGNQIRMSGVFGVCGVRNNNKRIYNKANYGQMVEALQKTILAEGCPGELEHPNSMNINLDNVSHKIEDIKMNEDGTITGTILLLNTPKGRIAQAIVEGGLPLFISSRGAGSIDPNGNVTLQTIKTFDLVGTPGFSQAKLSLKENQKFESLCESAEDGYGAWAIIEGEESSNEESKGVKSDDGSEKGDDGKGDDGKGDDGKGEEKKDKKEKDDKTNKTKVNMEDLKKSIDELSEKVTQLEAELHVAQESLKEATDKISEINEVDYNAIESWVKEECLPEYKKEIISEMAEYTNGWITDEVAPMFEGWITDEVAPMFEGWVVNEFGSQIEGWITEEVAPTFEGWITEEFAQTLENWITEEYSQTIDGWVNEELSKSISESTDQKISEAKKEINENVSAFLESKKESKYDQIDKMLESLSSEQLNKDEALRILKENQDKNNPFKGVYVVENMPSELRPSWEMLDEARKVEIVRMSRMYDFTKNGVLESFWAGVDFKAKPITESTKPQTTVGTDYQNRIVAQMMRMRSCR